MVELNKERQTVPVPAQRRQHVRRGNADLRQTLSRPQGGHGPRRLEKMAESPPAVAVADALDEPRAADPRLDGVAAFAHVGVIFRHLKQRNGIKRTVRPRSRNDARQTGRLEFCVSSVLRRNCQKSRRVFSCLAKVRTGSIFGCCLCGQHPRITPSVFFAIHQKFIGAAFGSAVSVRIRDFRRRDRRPPGWNTPFFRRPWTSSCCR